MPDPADKGNPNVFTTFKGRYLLVASAGQVVDTDVVMLSCTNDVQPIGDWTLPADHNYLASLPDGTRDEVVLRADGVAVLTHRCAKVVINGTTLQARYFNAATGSYCFGECLVSGLGDAVETYALTDRFPYRPDVNWAAIGGEGVKYSGGCVHISLAKTRLATIDKAGFNAWLAANPVTVVYKLATPTIIYSADNGVTWSTTDPAAGQSAIPLRKGTNNVWCTDPLSLEVGLEYVQDTNAVINELRAAIVASSPTS